MNKQYAADKLAALPLARSALPCPGGLARTTHSAHANYRPDRRGKQIFKEEGVCRRRRTTNMAFCSIKCCCKKPSPEYLVTCEEYNGQAKGQAHYVLHAWGHTVTMTSHSPRDAHHAMLTTPCSPRHSHHAMLTTSRSPRHAHHGMLTTTYHRHLRADTNSPATENRG